MPSESLVPTIIQGGAVGLALVALGIVRYALKMTFNHLAESSAQLATSNEIQHNILQALRDLAQASREERADRQQQWNDILSQWNTSGDQKLRR